MRENYKKVLIVVPPGEMKYRMSPVDEYDDVMGVYVDNHNEIEYAFCGDPVLVVICIYNHGQSLENYFDEIDIRGNWELDKLAKVLDKVKEHKLIKNK